MGVYSNIIKMMFGIMVVNVYKSNIRIKNDINIKKTK